MSGLPDADDHVSHVVYRCFDRDGQLLYIGCTRDLEYRMTLHHPLVLRNLDLVETEDFPNRLEARAAERAAITAEAPLLNKQHNPTRFRKQADGYVAQEPIHPLTQKLLDQERPVTRADLRKAMGRVEKLMYGGVA